MTRQLVPSPEASLSTVAEERLGGSDVMLRPSETNTPPILADELDAVAKRVRMRLNVGCGCNVDAAGDVVNLDLHPYPGIDVIHDLDHTPWPFESDTFTEVRGVQVFEHLQMYLQKEAVVLLEAAVER